MGSKLFVAAIAAVSLTATVSVAGTAAKNGSVPGQRSAAASRTLATGKTKVLATYVAADNPVANIVPGFNPAYSQVIRCTGSTTCTFVLSAMDQIGVCDTASYWAIAVSVDGAIINTQIQGAEPLTGGNPQFVIGNWQGFLSGVTPGKHTVELDTYVTGNCVQDQWSVNWSVARP